MSEARELEAAASSIRRALGRLPDAPARIRLGASWEDSARAALLHVDAALLDLRASSSARSAGGTAAPAAGAGAAGAR